MITDVKATPRSPQARSFHCRHCGVTGCPKDPALQPLLRWPSRSGLSAAPARWHPHIAHNRHPQKDQAPRRPKPGPPLRYRLRGPRVAADLILKCCRELKTDSRLKKLESSVEKHVRASQLSSTLVGVSIMVLSDVDENPLHGARYGAKKNNTPEAPLLPFTQIVVLGILFNTLSVTD
jgi:hypothetical protein